MLTLVYGYGSTQEIEAPLPVGEDGLIISFSDVTVRVLDDSGVQIISDDATVGQLLTTLAADAPAGSREIQLTDASDLGRLEVFVLIQGSDLIRHRPERCRAMSVNDNVVILQDRLARSYESGDRAFSAKVHYDIDLSDTDTWKSGYYIAIFETALWPSPIAVMFRIADQPTYNPITYDETRKWIPYLSLLRDSDDSSELYNARTNAWNFLRARIRGNGRDPDLWRDAVEVASAGGALAAAIFLMGHGKIEMAKELAGDPIGSGGIFEQMWSAVMKAPGWFDTDQDKAWGYDERRRPRRTILGRGL